ncbi:E3 ubiquitin-protein ligase Rnf220-like isoform 2-T2 [Discoglossus pictus]
MDNSSGLINTLTSPALLVMATSSDGPLGLTQQPPLYTMSLSMEKPPQISYLSQAYPLLYSSQDHLNPTCPPQLLSLAPQYGHHRLDRGGVGVLGYGALHHFSAFHLSEGVERLQAGYPNPKRLKGESEPPQIRYLPLETGLDASHMPGGAGIPPCSHRSSPKPRAVHHKRDKKTPVSLSLLCPLCHKHLQREELSQHLQQEMEFLTHLSDSECAATPETSRNIPQSPGVESSCESPLMTSEDGQKLDRQQIFQQVKSNREDRMGARAGKCKRPRVHMGETHVSQSMRSAELDVEGHWEEEETQSPGKPSREIDSIASPGSSCPSHSEESDSEDGPVVSTSRSSEPGVESLREKIQELTEKLRNTHTCHICLDSYSIPVTSIQCWHTHCEGCWLRALGAKKLCPQCNTITSPSDLRRVYL